MNITFLSLEIFPLNKYSKEFLRTGVCVPYIDCPDNRPPPEKPLTCDENEEYNKCGNRCGQSCEEVGKNKVCPKSNKCTSG